jgi:type II secretory pathway pseudopilin PulG
LAEVLLTLALLAIISAMTWTALQRPLARQRLHSAVDAVRTEWCQARIDAMKSGHTYTFRYMVHGDRYRLGAQEGDSANESSTAAQSSASEEDEMGDEPLPPPVDKTLPQGIRFLPADGSVDLASMSNDPETQPAQNGGDWSEPIYFYADGSTSDARLLLASDRHSAMRLLLRGVTGSVSVDDDMANMTQ